MPDLSNDRKKRYLQKIQHAKDRIALINEWINEELSDDKTVLAISKAFQEVVEVSTDLIAMALKDHGRIPGDDYSNIDDLYRLGIIEENIKDVLVECNGLRNRIVHLYNGLDTTLLFDSINRLMPVIIQYLEVIKTWLTQN